MNNFPRVFLNNKEEKEKAWKESLRSLSTATYAIRLDSGRYIYGSIREES